MSPAHGVGVVPQRSAVAHLRAVGETAVAVGSHAVCAVLPCTLAGAYAIGKLAPPLRSIESGTSRCFASETSHGAQVTMTLERYPKRASLSSEEVSVEVKFTVSTRGRRVTSEV